MADAPKQHEEVKPVSPRFVETLRNIRREHNRHSPDDQWDVDEVTDEFADAFYRRAMKSLEEDMQWDRLLKCLKQPAIWVFVCLFLMTVIGFIYALATLVPSWVALIWSFPICVAMVLAIPYLPQIPWAIRKTRELADVDKKSAESWAEGLVEYAIQCQSDIEQREAAIADYLTQLINMIVVVYLLPLVALASAGQRYKTYHMVLRLVPVSLNLVWDILFLVASFTVAQQGSPYGGLFLALCVGISSLSILHGNFKKVGVGKYREVTWLSMQRDSISLLPFFRLFAIVVVSFASCYHAIGIMDQEAFSRPIDAVDSVYFSLVTAATVGFGDISPVSTSAKVVCMVEIVCSFIITVFVIATILSVWQGTHLTDRQGAAIEEEPQPKSD